MGKRTIYAAFAAVFCLSSCSLLLNNREQSIRVITKKDLELRRVDTLNIQPRDTHYLRVRRGDCVELYFRLPDSTMSRYHLRARLTAMYWLGNYFSMGTGYFIDLLTEKRLGLPYNNIFAYDVKKRRIINYRQELPRRGTFSVGLGWSFLNAYNNLHKAYEGTGSMSGAFFTLSYHFADGYSLQFQSGLAHAGSVRERWGSKFWPRDRDTVLTDRTENHWFMLTAMRHFRNRIYIGAGLGVTPINYYRVEHYRWTIPIINRGDTLTEDRFSSGMIRSERFLKAGPVFQFGVDCNSRLHVGMTWMMLATDFLRRQDVVMANFVSFNLSFDLLKHTKRDDVRSE